MLKVHRDSWHYRIWCVGRSDSARPKNLCRYFWYINLIVVTTLVVGLLALAGAGGLIWLVYTHPTDVALTIMWLTIFTGAVVVLFWGGHKLHERHQAKKQLRRDYNFLVLTGKAEPLPEKEPSAFWEWVKAKKGKYCPMIEVVRDE